MYTDFCVCLLISVYACICTDETRCVVYRFTCGTDVQDLVLIRPMCLKTLLAI